MFITVGHDDQIYIRPSDHFELLYNCAQVSEVCDIKCCNHLLYPCILKPASAFLAEKDASCTSSTKCFVAVLQAQILLRRSIQYLLRHI